MVVQKIDSFQAFRTIAFFGIFFSHVEITSTGPMGVSMFIVLSGFLMSLSYFNRVGELPKGIKDSVGFSMNKMKKLYPLHFTTLMIIALYKVGALCKYNFPMKELINMLIVFPFQILMMQAWLPKGSLYFSFNKVSWYLSVCLFTYAVFPAFFRKFVSKKSRHLLKWAGGVLCIQIAVAIVSSIVTKSDKQTEFVKWLTYICPAYRMGDFILGNILGLLILRNEDKIKLASKFYTILELLYFLSVIAQIIFYTKGYLPAAIRYDLFWLPTSLFGVFIFYEHRGIIVHMISNKVFVSLGNISNYMFLLHQIVIGFTMLIISNKVLAVPLAFLITILTTIIYIRLEVCFLKTIEGR